jgi:hypothetical protein
MHPGTAVSQTYLGYTWWDLETDGEHMWPESQKPQSKAEQNEILARNPEGSTPRGKWADPEFLKQSGSREFNDKLDDMQLADFHGHGFLYRAVWKKDRNGNMLDEEGAKVAPDDPDKWKKAVHLKDIHLERGMHCADCHFTIDSHGDGKLYGEMRAATEIMCIDCHGKISDRATLTTTGNAGGRNLATSKTPFGPRFRWEGTPDKEQLIQRSALFDDVEWVVPQVMDTITEGHPSYNEKAAYAKTVRVEAEEGDTPQVTWGGSPDPSILAHQNDSMSCYSCHTAWMASCFGCHLPMRANEKKPELHNEARTQRNWTSYSFQTLRDEIFMLGKDGKVSGGRTTPVRSACAVMVGSQNQNREWVYSQQQTVSAEGFSGTAFSPHFPHTVRTTETKGCTDCHVASAEDNNAIMAQLLMLGTNAANFVGRFCYVASGGGGFDAVVVTEREEPQAVIGSRLHELAYPEEFAAHTRDRRELKEAYHHEANTVLGVPIPAGTEQVRSLQLRGEYLYTANGSGGLKVYDVAQIDHKGFSRRIVSAPVSPIGQQFYVDTEDATSVKAPSTQGVDPTRSQDPKNLEQSVHMIYAFLFVTDAKEGLILVGAGTLLDGDPDNNYLERALTFNPDGALTGARNCTVVGHYVYVVGDFGLVVIDMDDPLNPKITETISSPQITSATGVEVMFRYGFVTDGQGLKVLDTTDLAHPKLLPKGVKIADARGIYLSRSWGFIAAGAEGLVIVDLTRPHDLKVAKRFTANGKLDDVTDVKIAMTNTSMFAYVADGKNGLRVVQLTSPEQGAQVHGFAPPLAPRLIATYPTSQPALAVSEGIARDRAVDESGHQTAVFGRLGSRPFTRQEMERLFLLKDDAGRSRTYKVTDHAPKASGR